MPCGPIRSRTPATAQQGSLSGVRGKCSRMARFRPQVAALKVGQTVLATGHRRDISCCRRRKRICGVVLLAGGIGHYALHELPGKPSPARRSGPEVHLYYVSPRGANHAFGARASARSAAAMPQLHVVTCFQAGPDPSDRPGKHYDRRRAPDARHDRSCVACAPRTFSICAGPDEMMVSLSGATDRGPGVPALLRFSRNASYRRVRWSRPAGCDLAHHLVPSVRLVADVDAGERLDPSISPKAMASAFRPAAASGNAKAAPCHWSKGRSPMACRWRTSMVRAASPVQAVPQKRTSSSTPEAATACSGHIERQAGQSRLARHFRCLHRLLRGAAPPFRRSAGNGASFSAFSAAYACPPFARPAVRSRGGTCFWTPASAAFGNRPDDSHARGW